MRTLAARFAGKAPVQKRHQFAAGMVLCGAFCFPLLFFGILYNIFPQLKNIFDVWEVMNSAERCKLIQCVITRITVFENYIEIRPNLDGIKTLLAEAGMEV